MQKLFEISNKLLDNTSSVFKRSVYNDIWQGRLIEIRGARGVGKTTAMLQRAKELTRENPQQAIYITLDDIYFFNHSIIDVAETYSKYGGKYLFIDEVHKYPAKYKNFDWSAELKSIYDQYPELNIVYSGSSVLQVYKGRGDLSRRKVSYKMQGLSFGEYLSLNKIYTAKKYKIDEIIQNHVEISKEITSTIKVIPHFKQYLQEGYYPFRNEMPDKYCERLREVISVIIETDIPAVSEISFEVITKMKKLFAAISTSVPFTPNLTKLATELYIADYRTLYKYLNLLETAELLKTLSKIAKGQKMMRKPDKIFLDNPNLLNCIAKENANIGNVRETFFINQLSYIADIHTPPKGDFLVNDKYIFEVGGKNKDYKQIANIENSYLAIDDIETGFGNRIPLWLFGFLY